MGYRIKLTEVNTDDGLYFSSFNNRTNTVLERDIDSEHLGMGFTFINSVIFQMGATKTVVNRKVYTITDWMKEVGGFASFITMFLTTVIPFLRQWSI
jgi:hypothetical protein